MSSNKNNVVISVDAVSKVYHMYDAPYHRLLQLFARGNKSYFKEFAALKDVSFEVFKGETVGIIGRNGSGKSTLLQIIAGTLNPSSGSVSVKGKLAALLELGAGFNPEFTGRENVYLNGAILGFSREQMDKKFAEIEQFADIGAHIDQPVKTYSSGMYVRLAFAVQACVEPDVLIVDEALSVGDEKFQRKCFDYIDKLRENGCSILIVTHSTATIEKFCQRAVLIHQGVVQGVGEAKRIVDQYHALLYSDQKTYLRYVNQELSQQNADKLQHQEGNEAAEEKNSEVNNNLTSSQEKQGVHITSWQIFNQDNEQTEVFRVGERVRISFLISSHRDISELQAGLLIRTVEGVSVFGTSTLYHNLNLFDIKKGDSIEAKFEIDLNLCEGTYFITLAIAEAISDADMRYLDRKTDIFIIKVIEPRATCSGIARLPVTIQFKRVSE